MFILKLPCNISPSDCYIISTFGEEDCKNNFRCDLSVQLQKNKITINCWYINVSFSSCSYIFSKTATETFLMIFYRCWKWSTNLGHTEFCASLSSACPERPTSSRSGFSWGSRLKHLNSGLYMTVSTVHYRLKFTL